MGRLRALITVTLLAAFAAAGSASADPVVAAMFDDTVGGSLTCTDGQVVWISERSSAGTTTVAVGPLVSRRVKQNWSTTRLRSGLTSASWRVASTGVIDRSVTGAYCGP